jgi:addiction module RelE/StbE family toxin
MRTHWTETARADLRSIRSYIARDSERYARETVKRIRAAIALLKRFPERGGMVEDWARPDVREILVGNYRIIYRIIAAEVWIITIIHGARLLPEEPDL